MGVDVRVRVFAAGAMALLAAGCATVTRGSQSDLGVESDPPGATATTTILSACNGPCPNTDPTQTGANVEFDRPGPGCVTPCQLRLSRHHRLRMVIAKDGYESQTVLVETRVAGAGAAGFLGNALVGGAVGGVVDIASGATLEHVPNPVQVTLVRLAPPAPPPRRKPAAKKLQ